MRTVAIVNLKGGSGKSTLAVQLALNWANFQQTALADIDPQGSAALVLQGSNRLNCVRSSGAKLPTLKSTLERGGFERLVVDTPGSIQDDVASAVAAANLVLMVVRPSYLDLAAAVTTAQLVRQLQRPALIVLNQAPPSRDGIENPAVVKAMEALRLLRLPIAGTIVRARAIYGRATERGVSVGAVDASSNAVLEIAALRSDVDANSTDTNACAHAIARSRQVRRALAAGPPDLAWP